MRKTACRQDRRSRLHALDIGGSELGALHLGRTADRASQIVGDLHGGNGFLQIIDHQVGRLDPPEMPQHHLTRKNDTTRVHLVQSGMLGCRTMSRLENGVSGLVIDSTTRSDTDTAYPGCQGVGDGVTIQIQGRILPDGSGSAAGRHPRSHP